MINHSRDLFGLATCILIAAACNQPTDDECPMAIPDSTYRVEADTLCLGLWQWQVSYEYHRNWNDEWFIFDTIYPGDSVTGFETVNHFTVNIDDRSICINKDGQSVIGCYSEWRSYLHTSGSPEPTYSAVASFYQWNASDPGYGSIGWVVRLIGDWALDYSPQVLPYNTSISGSPTYEEETGIRYSSLFVRVE